MHKILIVEDDQFLSKLYKIKLQKEGFEIESKKEEVEGKLTEMKEKFNRFKQLSREDKIKQCIELKEKGLSLRKIADILGIGKSTVKDYLEIGKQREGLPKIDVREPLKYEEISEGN